MAQFNASDLRARADKATPTLESAGTVLNRKAQASTGTDFDIFLSHSIDDQKLILGIWYALEDLGYRVYVDWIHDRHLNRTSVTKETAQLLRARMAASKCLFYATTTASAGSKWMPWELGFKDGHNRRSAILPIASAGGASDSYHGQEYLGIYPYITKDKAKGGTEDKLWVRTSDTCYVIFDSWLSGSEPTQR